MSLATGVHVAGRDGMCRRRALCSVKNLDAEVKALKLENSQLKEQVTFFRRYYGQGTIPLSSTAGSSASSSIPTTSATAATGTLKQSPVATMSTPAAAAATALHAGLLDDDLLNGDEDDETAAALRLLATWATGSPERERDGSGGDDAASGAVIAFGSDEFEELSKQAEATATTQLQHLEICKDAIAAER